MAKETDFSEAKEYYPKKIKCRYCGKLCHGIMAGPYNPHQICNDCAVPVSSDGEYYTDADGSVSLA